MFYSERFLEAKRQSLLDEIAKFQCRIDGGDWQDAVINKKVIEGDAVVVDMYVASTGSADNITAVRCLDATEQLIGEQEVEMPRSGLQSTLFRFTFPVVEMPD